jgi:putative (di)nucleoside polyphosphate hydrolase
MQKEITYGVLFIKKLNQEKYLFMGHSTGNKFWDIPKGGSELNETPVESAIREVKEETGFDVIASELLDLGIFQYNRQKDMHLFLHIGHKTFEPEDAYCESTFTCPHTGKERPELDDFKYVIFSEVIQHAAKSFKNVFDSFLSIDLRHYI